MNGGWTRRIVAIAAVVMANVAAAEDLVQYVNTLVGTVAEGNTFPGVCRPFGLVQASPDSGLEPARRCAGFDLRDDVIRCFSQTHANGTGRPALGDGALMPFTGTTDGVDYSSAYDKREMTTSPDYFACRLSRYDVRVEATASDRVAWYRLTYPAGKAAKLLVDASATLNQAHNIKKGPPIRECRVKLSEDRREICVFRRLQIWEEGTVGFVYRLNRPWISVEERPTDRFIGQGARYELDFGELDSPLEVQVALSSVSVEGAARNLAAESDRETFDSVRETCREVWNALFGRMTVTRGAADNKRNWYTALYHLCIQPNLHSDVDGSYRAEDGTVKKAPNGVLYSMFSLWDTFRAAHPLYTVLVPERMQGFVDSLWRYGEDHGHLPMWVMWGRETHDMVGVHSIPVLVDAYAKGWRAAAPQAMLDKMIETLTGHDAECPKNGFNLLHDYGYMPYDQGPFNTDCACPFASVSRTLEISYDWWCVARFARRIGNEATARRADRYAASWRNLYDASTGFMRAKACPLGSEKGRWRTPFDPRENRQTKDFWGDYTEANAYVYTWHVFQEPDELTRLMGGRTAAVAALDRFFSTPPKPGKVATGNNDEGGVLRSGQIGQYWHGNEPSHHIAYFYTLLDRPDKTAELVRKICREAYLPQPDGLCGNDDCGQMSAWYLFSSMGFYPFNPCDDGYVLGAPQNDEMRLVLPNGRTLRIVVADVLGERPYGTSVTLNGHRLKDSRLSHAQLLEGGVLRFERKEKHNE